MCKLANKKNSSHIIATKLVDDVILDAVLEKVGLSVDESIALCKQTITQHQNRSKRITASLFGKVINPNYKVYPKSLISAVVDKKIKTSMPASLRLDIDNEDNAIENYEQLYDNTQVKRIGFVVSLKWQDVAQMK